MKRILLLLAAMAAITIVACEPDTPTNDPEPPAPVTKYQLELTSADTMEFSAERSIGMIEFTLSEVVEDATRLSPVGVMITTDADWIELDGEMVLSSPVSFVVEANEGEAREATIDLTFDEQQLHVTIKQAAKPAEPEPEYVELPYLSGLYFGNQYGATDNDYNYSLVLATTEHCIDIITGMMYIEANSQYLFLDLYSESPAEEYNVRFNVPIGEYTIDANNSCKAGTISAKYSSLYTTFDTYDEDLPFVSGSITVTAEGIYATVTTESGEERHLSCPTRSVDNSQHFGPSFSPPEQSTLEGDINIEFSDCTFAVENYGDYYVVGKNNWFVYLNDNATGDNLSFELLAPLDAVLPTGEFCVTNDLNEEQMALPGYVDASESMWSWYRFYDDYSTVTASAPITDGKITITDNGDGTLTAVVDVVDDMDNRITGEVTSTYIDLTTRATGRTSRKY